jgi:hypothetical protein
MYAVQLSIRLARSLNLQTTGGFGERRVGGESYEGFDAAARIFEPRRRPSIRPSWRLSYTTYSATKAALGSYTWTWRMAQV